MKPGRILTSVVALISALSYAHAESLTPENGLAPGSPSTSQGPNWAVCLPKADSVVFHGVVNFDKAGGAPGTMMYPTAAGAVGLLAAVLTHGALAESTKNAEKKRIVEQADGVLSPYQDVLQTLTYRDLIQKSIAKASIGDKKTMVGDVSEAASSDWVIQSSPVFLMTQDQSALVLENELVISKPGGNDNRPYQVNVRVVSDVQDAPDMKAFWTADQATHLKDEMSRLYAQSLDLALNDAQRVKSDVRPGKTVRYFEGKEEKMERGELVNDCCGRIVVRTLRGGLMSVPTKRPEKVAAATVVN